MDELTSIDLAAALNLVPRHLLALFGVCCCRFLLPARDRYLGPFPKRHNAAPLPLLAGLVLPGGGWFLRSPCGGLLVCSDVSCGLLLRNGKVPTVCPRDARGQKESKL